MDCYYHHGKNSTDNCAICGKPICKECGLEISGNIYCKDCLQKIVGAGLQNNTQNVKEPLNANVPPQTEPPQYEKINTDVSPEIEHPQYDKNPYENISQETPNFNEPIVEKPPTLEKKETPFVPPSPENDIYSPQEDYYPKEEKVFNNDDFIYPDHSYQPDEKLEKKYEDYLNELYEEPDVPLSEQLAMDEEKYGPLTNEPYKPYVENEYVYDEPIYPEHPQEIDNTHNEPIIKSREPSIPENSRPIHNNIHYKEDKKEPTSIIDVLLTITLVILIIIVVFYVVYLVLFSSTYPSFTDAIYQIIFQLFN